jgi:hypothetical protein
MADSMTLRDCTASRSKIYEWLRAGTLRSIRLDGRTKVVIASLLELAERDTGAVTP